MSIISKLSVIVTLIFWMTVEASAANIKAAMVVSFSGTVEIFSALKNESAAKDQTFVIFDNSRYVSRRVQSGTKVHPGDILRSGNDGKMKIIYDNGDVFILGPATAFIIPSKIEKGAAPAVTSEVLYGKVRAMIDKKGPLSGLKMNTKTAVAGVRGTDLYVSFSPLNSNTQVHVLRGEVEVQSIAVAAIATSTEAEAKIPAPLIVKTGQKAVTETKDEKPVLQILTSTQQDLKSIQASTTTPAPDLNALKGEEKKQIEQLLKTSQEKIMEDVKTTTPEVYKTLQAQKATSIEDISQVMVNDLSKTAPKGSSKPRMSDFEKDEDVYQKYFKPVGQ